MNNYKLYSQYRHKHFTHLVLNTSFDLVTQKSSSGETSNQVTNVTFSNTFHLIDLPPRCPLMESVKHNKPLNLPGDSTSFVFFNVNSYPNDGQLYEVGLQVIGSLSDCWVGEGEIITLA